MQNLADAATSLSARHLIEPLAKIAANHPGWSVQTILAEQATKSRLVELVGGNDTPALLFTASHGVGFPTGDPRQRRHQGALLCQDWPGPLQWPEGRPIPEEYYLSCDDITDNARVDGLLTFHFACYGVGTSALDDFTRQALKEAVDIAPHAFVACLPQRLLSHPQGGALAVIGHVGRAWRWSFLWGRAGQQLETFESTLKRLLKGYPVGLAMEYFGERHAEVATMLSAVLEDIRFGKEPDDAELADLWTANNDARNYVIVGDPAVRLPVKAVGE